MKKHCVFAILLATLLALCLPLSCLAKPPLKATLLGVVVGSGTSTASYHTVNIMPVNNNTFGIYSPTALELNTNLFLYFGLGTDEVDSFQIKIKKLSTTIQDNTSTTPASNAMYMWNYNGEYTSGQVSIRTEVQSSRVINSDGTTDYSFTWHRQSANVDGKSVFSFILPFQTFMLQNAPIYFEVTEFSVNGMTAEEIEINQYAEQFQARLERLEDIENAAYQQIDIHVNDIRQYLQNTDGDHYFADFHYLFSQSTLLSTMCAVVALFGILGFILFGKKV